MQPDGHTVFGVGARVDSPEPHDPLDEPVCAGDSRRCPLQADGFCRLMLLIGFVLTHAASRVGHFYSRGTTFQTIALHVNSDQGRH